MGIMDQAANAAAAARERAQQDVAEREGRDRDREAQGIARKWGVPASFAGVVELTMGERRPSGRPSGYSRRVLTTKRERRDAFLLADEVRVVFVYDASVTLQMRLVQTCPTHGDYPGGVVSPPRSAAEGATGEEQLVAAVASALIGTAHPCMACVAAREQATCPTCGHDLSEPRAVQW